MYALYQAIDVKLGRSIWGEISSSCESHISQGSIPWAQGVRGNKENWQEMTSQNNQYIEGKTSIDISILF